MIIFNSDYCLEHYLKESAMVKGITSPIPELRPTITLIGSTIFSRITIKTRRRHDIEVARTIIVYELKKVLKIFATQCPGKGLSASVSDEDIQRKIPIKLHDLVYAFRKTLIEDLSPHRSYDLKIELKEGFESPFESLYKLSRDKLKIL